MPYKRTLRDNNTFLVLYQEYDEYFCHEYNGIKKAVEGYRKLRTLHGDNCRLVKVVADYGEEV